MDRLTKNAGGTISVYNYNADSALADLVSTPNVVIKDGAGTTVVSGGATRVSLGLYEFAVPSTATSSCDTYTAEWTAGTTVLVTTYEVYGGPLFAIADLRASDRALGDATAYPTPRLVDAREWATERFEEAARRAFSERSARLTLSGNGRAALVPPHRDLRSILSLSVVDETGAAVSYVAADVTIHGDCLYLPGDAPWPKGRRNVSIRYTYGTTAVPEPVRKAVMRLARLDAVPQGIPERATSIATDAGSFRLTLAGRDGATGIPEVDETIRRFGFDVPSVGGVSL